MSTQRTASTPASASLLRGMFDASVASAQPERCVPPHLPEPDGRRLVVVGAGKAVAGMARAVEEHWDGPLSGVVVTRYGYGVPCERIEVLEASHPVPDAAGAAAAQRILATLSALGEQDRALVLISGGASALLSMPAPGLTLEDKQTVNQALLRSGANITEMNCVRKHLSAIKGGRLAAAAYPAPLLTLAISDVPGDDLSVIGSGPTVADATTYADARAILERYGIEPPPAVARHLREAREETPKPGDPRLAHCETVLVATPAMALEAAAAAARRQGLSVVMLGDAVEGEARAVAAEQARLARRSGPGTVLLSGGEVTVTVTGNGRGGPNTEFALALALELDGAPGVWAIACDTDGIDGTEDNAGALVRPDTLARAAAARLDAAASLADNDGYAFFAALGDLVITGPTLTNVNDFRAILLTR